MEGYCAPLKVSLKCLSHSNIWTVTRGEKCIRCNLGGEMAVVGGCADFQGYFGHVRAVCQCSVYTHAHTHRQSCRMPKVPMVQRLDNKRLIP